ncbi:MAG: acyl-phosphate glycerol 3-phosphate acyltransferase [Omnitrophica bacterium RIFCSPLOWO2_12_FULL_44_17]|uniref:Glycerol-3-phosphate acyltransferase n=1 Tax=Candidatus Danuiimicrobium aquiferis TaxID=1801832 RepID=A0A1G1KVA3_9BACT|nr:MAG: acyl-phosphate glycerol 3-phosphate acyltransferase [Omnitrophica bacterium RIFCSPHIGHO2_02_FULL_45_28]OGW92505.1 MAG: acyl-phosphate glycerol 3-phosphate acyltransferase [Omnitrophica bacterium RIFCSPHIGHO2_12_FULL_44_12]OGW96810.1 MAG: acyl-phosphate glycerol 3-phosphate acyltransferase [Omnitrophica bacterium RIFCSPLOWO2_12_FULL_44_17]OGX03812.1 MAG: acyl-phosphate glycerol 3-phosphate acyltransferase [Omnitrophica bacterium RIFCSPLOWO2_02_FULL_44_11]
MNFVNDFLWIFIAYFIGSVPTAYLVAKRAQGIDIRKHGSGNVGATNVFRVIGKKWGTTVLVVDILKGWIVTAILFYFCDAFQGTSPVLKQLFLGAAAISGHTWSPWLKFKGGKGVATSAGVLLGIFPMATLVAILIWILCFVISRYVSLSSMITAIFFPFLIILYNNGMKSFRTVLAVSIILVLFLVYNHRENIRRLIKGEEHRANWGKKKEKKPA